MNYDIEKTLAKYGGEADKGIERTCGNCICYDAEAFRCCNASIDDETEFYKKTNAGCWYHMTEAEKQRLESLVNAYCDRQRKSRIEEERRQGTGQCQDCPYRRKALEMEVGAE